MTFYKKIKTTTEQCAGVLKKAHSIAIFAHTRPDGDTIGASMALCLALKQLGKNATIFCDTDLTESFLQFDGVKENVNKQFFGEYDTMVSVDCADLLRLGEYADVFSHFANTMTVDHHGGEYYSRNNCVLEYSCTCMIVDEILTAMNVDYTQDIATFLYMGLCTDTGNFAHSNTDEKSFLLASKLVKFGALSQKVNRIFFKDTTLARTKLLGTVLQRIRTYYDDKLAIVYTLQSDLDKYALDNNATEGFVQNAINIDTVLVGVSICQHSENVYKISMRGKDFDVRRICQQFGGGGHLLASGCMISGFFEDVVERIVKAVGNYL